MTVFFLIVNSSHSKSVQTPSPAVNSRTRRMPRFPPLPSRSRHVMSPSSLFTCDRMESKSSSSSDHSKNTTSRTSARPPDYLLLPLGPAQILFVRPGSAASLLTLLLLSNHTHATRFRFSVFTKRSIRLQFARRGSPIKLLLPSSPSTTSLLLSAKTEMSAGVAEFVY